MRRSFMEIARDIRSDGAQSSERNQREREMLFRETRRRQRRLASPDSISMPCRLTKRIAI